MDAGLRRTIEPELEPGERVLWAARPSVRHYVQRRLPITLLFVGAAIAFFVTSEAIRAAIGEMGGYVAWIAAGVAALPVLVMVADIRLRRRTAYAVTGHRLIRAGGRSRRTNRPGQTFSYRPEELRFLEISSFLSQHVYFDQERWGSGEGRRIVLIGFEDVPDARAVRDRIRAWLDDYQQRALSDIAERHTVTNDDYGFRLEVPAAWTIEIGTGDDTDPRGATPADWEHGLRPWDGASGGWNRLRVTGPADATLAIDARRAPGWQADDELDPMAEGALELFFGLQRETREIEFLGMPATEATWSADEMVFRMVLVPRGEVEYRICLLTRSTMPRLMNELQGIAESLRVRGAESTR
jgi:hypothetical protein